MSATAFQRRRRELQRAASSAPKPPERAPPEDWYPGLNAREAIEAIEEGAITPEEALRLERERDHPRKTVLDALE